MKLIIDTDCGVDDSLSLIYALRTFDVIGITCISGNCHIDDVVKNVAIVQDIINTNIPIYKGSSDFILSDWSSDITWSGHGTDGLGNKQSEYYNDNLKQPESENAIDAIIRLTKEYDDVHLICIGPLTNIGLATLLDPTLPNRIKSFTIMGGTHQCKGNTGLASEFNIHVDPEAASICFRKYFIRMITWETTYKNVFSWEWYNNLPKNKVTDFIKNINENNIKYNNNKNGLMVCDLIAMTSYITEDKDKSIDMHCVIELSGKLTRGATIYDWQYNNNNNCRIIKINMNKVYETVNKILY
jgi:purine nucleosidase